MKMDIQEVGCGGYGVDRAGSGQGQVAGTRKRYVIKHNQITAVYLMTVMETTTRFGLYWPSSGCLGMTHFLEVAGTYECGNEPSGPVNYGEFPDQLWACQLLKKDSGARSK